jgi:hypothetical protein
MTEESAEMDIHLPPVKRELNINTFVMVGGFVITLLVTCGGWLWTYSQSQFQITQNSKAIADNKAVADLKIAQLEVEARRIDGLAFRISQVESNNNQITIALSDLRDAVSNQSGDLKVVREILQRLESQVAGPGRSTLPTALRQ